MAQFQAMVDRVNKSIVFWRQSKFSRAGKAVLINSTVMAIPVYYLSVYSISDSIMDKISKAARKFLWSSGGNSSGIPLVNWNDTALGKSEGV